MTLNATLSIPNALKAERPEDYYKNTATIEWPDGADGQPLAIRTGFFAAAVFKAGGHVALAKEFVRFLVAEGWLAHYLDFSGERMLPPMPKLLEQPFWLDPSDRAPHGLGDPVPDPPARLQLLGRLRRSATPLVNGRTSGPRRSIASRPRASAPSRRSTRRSPGSSRSSPNSRGAADAAMRRAKLRALPSGH